MKRTSEPGNDIEEIITSIIDREPEILAGIDNLRRDDPAVAAIIRKFREEQAKLFDDLNSDSSTD